VLNEVIKLFFLS